MPKTIDPRIHTVKNDSGQDVLVVDGLSLKRMGPHGIELRAFLRTMTNGEQVAIFTGGAFGEAQLHMFAPKAGSLDDMNQTSSADRLKAHFEGYCRNNDAGLVEGAIVRFHTSGLIRKVTVLRTPEPNAKTVYVSGFRYKHGGMAKPRRIEMREIISVYSNVSGSRLMPK